MAEVLSDSTRGHDLRRKRGWYAEAGVVEYGVLDPGARSVGVLTLTDEGYRTAATVTEGGAAAVALDGFCPDAAALFHRPAFG